MPAPARFRFALLPLALAACGPAPASDAAEAGADQAASSQPAADPPPLFSVEGFAGPESVRYDPEQDVYFVGNFNGGGNDADNNGFISRVGPDGTVEEMRFVEGGQNGVTLHAPRGMTIVGDTLWAADVGAVRGFDRRTGAPLATVDFTALEPGFLNDIAPGPDGALYVTDTGGGRIYRIAGGIPSVALEGADLVRPNGITWDRAGGRMIVLPHDGRRNLWTWNPGDSAPGTLPLEAGGRFDGVEVLEDGSLLFTSQADSTVVLLNGSEARVVARTTGTPADIGVDTRRHRVAVPYIALNRVDVWELPSR